MLDFLIVVCKIISSSNNCRAFLVLVGLEIGWNLEKTHKLCRHSRYITQTMSKPKTAVPVAPAGATAGAETKAHNSQAKPTETPSFLARRGNASRNANILALVSLLFLGHLGYTYYKGEVAPILPLVYFPASLVSFYAVGCYSLTRSYQHNFH